MHRILLINCCHFLIDNKIVSLGNNYKDGVLASSARLLAIIGNPAEEGMALVKTMLKHLLTFVRPENCLLTRRERRSCCTCPSRLWRRRASSLNIKKTLNRLSLPLYQGRSHSSWHSWSCSSPCSSTLWPGRGSWTICPRKEPNKGIDWG